MENNYHTENQGFSSENRKYFKPRKTALWRWGTFALLSLCAVFTLYVWHLDVTIRKQFEGKRWAIPARIYARSLELYTGLNIDMAQLEKELLLAGYLKKDHAPFPGSFARQSNTIHLITRPFDFGDSFEPSRDMDIRFTGSQVAGIREHDSGFPLDIVSHGRNAGYPAPPVQIPSMRNYRTGLLPQVKRRDVDSGKGVAPELWESISSSLFACVPR